MGGGGGGVVWRGGDGLAWRFWLRNQTQTLTSIRISAAVLISVIVYSPTFKTIRYYFIFPKKCKSVLYFLRRILWGGEGDLIEPSGLEVFPLAPIWVCIHRWTLLKPGNLAIFYKTLRKQCMKTENFWNRSSCIFKRLILLIFILFFFATWVLYYPGYCGLTRQLQDLSLKIGLEDFVASVG